MQYLNATIEWQIKYTGMALSGRYRVRAAARCCACGLPIQPRESAYHDAETGSFLHATPGICARLQELTAAAAAAAAETDR